MSKTLEKLFNKAMKTGYANINGRMRAYGYVGEIQSKYTMEYFQDTGNFYLYHWGTLILKLGSLKDSKPTVQEFYGESKSDRDALCWVFNHLDLPYFAKYRPSVHEFWCMLILVKVKKKVGYHYLKGVKFPLGI